jgi:hypothetical protein
MQNEQKKTVIIKTLRSFGLIAWAIAIITGAAIGGSDRSIIGGAFAGFLVGFGILILIHFFIQIIENPSLLKYFLITPPIGFLIGLFWGLNGGLIGALIGGIVAFLFVADLIKKD